MVVQGDMKGELVYADTKMPFKEHAHGGKIYVEVEPDVDYFISVQRVDQKQGERLYLELFVDEQDLGYYYTCNELVKAPKYRGIWTLSKSVSTMKALRFAKPRISEDGSNVNPNLIMGKVEVKVYEAVFDGFEDSHEDVSSSFAAKAVDMNQNGLSAKKSLRSDEGEVTESTAAPTGQEKSYKCGAHLDTITLNYCAALGLIEVGVLKKPDMWTHHRMKRPASPSKASNVKPKKIRAPALVVKPVELFDLADEDSSDEDHASDEM